MVVPIQTVDGPLMLITGLPLTIISPVGSELHPTVDVKINRAVPFKSPVTKPAFVTDATDGCWLIHVPPEVGLNWLVRPWQIADGPVIPVVGFGRTVRMELGSEIHPVVLCV